MHRYRYHFQVQANFDDMIGMNAGKCLYNQRKLFDKIMHKWQPLDQTQMHPVKSRVLLQTNDCDAISVLQANVQEKSVKKKHRIEQLNRVFAQRYMQSAWKDFEFINELKANKVLSKAVQNPVSFDAINREIQKCVETTGKFIVSNSI